MLLLLALAVLIAGAFLEQTRFFQSGRSRLHEQRLAFGQHDFTRLHYLLLQRGLVQTVGAKDLPSSAILPQEVVEDRLPALSIVIDPVELHHPRYGLYHNVWKKGRRWERRATISYFEHGQLRYETVAGLRLHGGKSRGGRQKSFQLVFRRTYAGVPRAEPGIFFNGESGQLQRLVVINTNHAKRFLNALALELAAGVGCLTSRSQPVRLWINGERMPVGYFLFEHQSREFLRHRYGHDDFHWVRLKSGRGKRHSVRAYEELRHWLNKDPGPMTMERAGQHFDVEGFSAWVLAMTFCGTSDEDQGGYFYDLRDPNARWGTLTWDMDGSFLLQRGSSPVDEFRFGSLKGTRGKLFRRLMREDPAYRDWFRNKAQEALATTLSPEGVRQLFGRYRGYLESDLFVGQERVMEYLDRSEAYALSRSANYLAALERYLAQEVGLEGEPQEEEAGEPSGEAE